MRYHSNIAATELVPGSGGSIASASDTTFIQRSPKQMTDRDDDTNREHRKPIIHAVGNAHLDPAWMWTWEEGMEAFIATCRSALDRMDETPGFIFTCSSAAHYRWVETTDPELFERIRQRVHEGRWAIVGGWWTQADCNLPSGEGFVRQALLGQRYFISRFGRIAATGYSPDAFGHTGGLPQLLARAGMSAYIFCRPDPTELPLPSPLVRWVGADGSSVLAYRVPFHYNMYESSVPKKVHDMAAAFDGPSSLTSDGTPLRAFGEEWCIFYGVGNHGGGPTREHLQQLSAIAADPTEPMVLFSDPDRFFDRIAREESEHIIPRWTNDLQLNAPGCYSASSTIKQLNRRSEHLMMRAETFATMASLMTGATYPDSEFRRAWENICFNHFHDILCGVAIREALTEAIEMYGESVFVARRSTRYALQRLARTIDTTGPGRTLLVFNSHSWPVEEYVTFELWHDIDKSLWPRPVEIRVTDDDGNDLPCQTGFTSGKIGKDRIAVTFRASVPALGWRSYRVFYGETSPHAGTRPIIAREADGNDPFVLENDLVRVEISPFDGTLTRILHKDSGIDFLRGHAALPVVIDDPTDSWGHGVTRFDRIVGTFADAEVRVVENGPTHATIRTRSRFHGSWVQQDFRLHAGSGDIHVDVKLFWDDRNRMMKLAFPTAAVDALASYEGAYSVTVKPCDGIERPGGAWAAISGAIGPRPATLVVVNDAKHGYSAEANDGGTTLFMTVLRSPAYALHDPHPFHPDEDLDYMDQGIQRFSYVVRTVAGTRADAEPARAAMLLNAPLVAQFESEHPGGGGPCSGRSFEGIEIGAANVIASVIKAAEDGDGWIVRLFETDGMTTETEIAVRLFSVSWTATLAPYQISTWAIRNGKVSEVDLIELPATRPEP